MHYFALTLTFGLFLLASCNQPAKTPETSQAPVRETTCYVQRSGDNLSVIQITVQGDSVSGYIAQEIAGGKGAQGSFIGRKEKNMLTADYTFIMDNTLQVHEVMFKLEGDKLFQGAGGMISDNGKMILRDKFALHWLGPLLKTNCNEVEDAIDRARQVVNSIRKSG